MQWERDAWTFADGSAFLTTVDGRYRIARTLDDEGEHWRYDAWCMQPSQWLGAFDSASDAQRQSLIHAQTAGPRG